MPRMVWRGDDNKLLLGTGLPGPEFVCLTAYSDFKPPRALSGWGVSTTSVKTFEDGDFGTGGRALLSESRWKNIGKEEGETDAAPVTAFIR